MKNCSSYQLLPLFFLFLGIGLALWPLSPRAQGPEVIYTYDDLGRLKQVIDQNGEIRTYTYDAVGNILSIEAGAGDCPIAAPVITGVHLVGSCYAGRSCRLTIDGSGLADAGVTTQHLLADVGDCVTDCTQISCQVTILSPPSSGSLEIVVTTPFGSAQASITLPSPPTLGSGQADLWHFTANRGEVVTLMMNRLPNLPDGSSTLDPALELRDSQGVLLASDDDGGTVVPPGPGKNALIRGFTLPATDTYLVTARGSSGSSGPYALAVDPPTVILVPGPPVTPPPEVPAFLFTGTIAVSGERDTHTFPANRGTVVLIMVNRVANNPDGSGTLDPTVELQDSRGFVLETDADGGTNQPPGPGRNALIPNFALPATDTYRVVVSGSGGTKGPYEVKVFFLE